LSAHIPKLGAAHCVPEAFRQLVDNVPTLEERCAGYTHAPWESVLNGRLFHLYRTAAKLPISDFSQSATDEPSTITGTA
jgi:hypothetical protein